MLNVLKRRGSRSSKNGDQSGDQSNGRMTNKHSTTLTRKRKLWLRNAIHVLEHDSKKISEAPKSGGRRRKSKTPPTRHEKSVSPAQKLVSLDYTMCGSNIWVSQSQHYPSLLVTISVSFLRARQSPSNKRGKQVVIQITTQIGVTSKRAIANTI